MPILPGLNCPGSEPRRIDDLCRQAKLAVEAKENECARETKADTPGACPSIGPEAIVTTATERKFVQFAFSGALTASREAP
jgi:hypothetical protein